MKKPNKIFALLMVLMTFSMSRAYAADEFYVKSIDVDAGAPATLESFLNNEIPYYGFQAEISLSAGLSLQKVTLNEKLVSRGYDIVTNTVNGNLRIVAFSNNNTAISSDFGNLLNFEVDVADDFVEGKIIISKIKFVNSENKDVAFPDTEALIGIAAKAIVVEPTTLLLEEGDSADLTATIYPSTTRDKTIIWSSSDESVATVSSTGKVTAIKVGEATITASTINGKTASCAVTVSPKYIPVTGMIVSEKELYMVVGDKHTIMVTVEPENATDKSVTWKSDSPEIASVDDNGNITAITPGIATITVTTANGITESIKVIVTEKEPDIIPATGITLDKEKLEMTVGDTDRLFATVLPENATDKTVVWKSDDESVATVDAEGNVVATGEGQTIITASCGGYSATCSITVYPMIIPVSSLKLDKESAELKVGETTTITAIVLPEDATDKTVTWSSSDQSIATVDSNGNVVANSLGETIISATCGDKTATCIVTVIPTPVESLSLNPTSAELKVGQTIAIQPTILPEDATDKTITWNSSDSNIAAVDTDGNVTAIALGEAIITATCGDETAYCSIKVVPTPAESITIDPSSAELKVGETVELTATVLPETTTDQSVTWSSNNESVAIVDENGLVTAVGLGSTSITATCGSIYTSCIVTVVPTPATGITLDKDAAELQVGETLTISATVEPENTTDPTIVWTSSDDKIATVDANGNIIALALGEVTITAICGDVTATCKITVIPTPAERIGIIPDTAEIKVNETISLTATVFPENATYKNVTWTSNDESIATVDANGIVTGVAIGEAIITASCGDVSATCLVTVIPTPVSSITLTNTELTMMVGETAEIDAIAHPAEAEVETILWTSSDESIATVDAKGNVTALREGNTIITATYIADPSVTAICKVTVKSNIIAVSEIFISDKTLEMYVDDKYTLSATIKPENASDPALSWRSSDWAVAVVSENGEVTATGVGTAIIYVSSSNGLTEQCVVTVKERIIDPSGITLSNTELLMREGYTTNLIAIVRPDNASDKSVTWTTSDPEIAIVDENGNVTAIKQGNAIISATTVNGHRADCYVTVVPVVITVEAISINRTTLELNINETYTLIATITPEDATDKTVTWKSSDPSIATVSEYGVVTGITAGTAVIYASSSNGLTVECIVTVIPGEIEVTGISISNTELLMREEYTAELFAIVHPENASDKTVFWSTSDPEIATVDENGVVTAIKQGIATITATSAYGQQATCVVTVVPVVKSVEEILISDKAIEILVDDTYQLTATILPEDATDKTVTWRSTDPSIATVSENGLVTGISAGTITVYASSSNGLTAECTVTVIPRDVDVTSISLTNTELLMIEGDTAEILAIVRPENATDKSVTWTSSDESIAIVDENGIITAVKPGNAIISATSENGVSANCYVTVVPRVVAVESLTISDTSLEMNIGDTYTLSVTVNPDNATDPTLTWKSSDSSIVTVDENGNLTAISAGTAIIYVSSSNGLTVECTVTVLPGIIPVISISLSNTELLMREGYSTELIAIVHPDNATDKRVVWSSDNEDVAIVDSNGNVTAVGVGTAIITVTSVFDPSVKTQCVVTVEKEDVIIAVESITLSDYELTMTEGDTHTIIATITPEDASDQSVTWKSSDITVAIVTEDGEVIAVGPGTAIIYASSSNGLTAECVVTVIPDDVDPTSITLTNTELLMREGHTADLIAIVGPENATDKSVTWTSSDESIATVDENGIVTAIKPGTAVITATTANGIEAYCHVTVIPVVIAVESITLNRYTLEMEIEETFQLIATVLPEDATDKTVTWKSSDKTIATVSDDGVVTAIAAGTTTIYASTSNGLTAECVVTVNPGTIEVTGISLTNTELLMIEGDVTDLIAIVLPDNATDKSVTWSSSDEGIASVDENGIVTAIKQGNCVITATASNGIKAECYVTVLPLIIAVEGISISDTEIEMIVGDTYPLTAAITPDNATDKTITWKSSDLGVTTVSNEGLVTAIEVGKSIIYASSSNGLTAECRVTVKPGTVEVESIALTNTELLMVEGDVTELYAIISPYNATDKTVTWTSSDEGIATVDNNGTVTAIKQGNTIVTATASNGVKAECHVTVVPLILAVDGITVSKTKLTLIEGDEYQLTATVTPENATDKTITWKSSDRAIATVSDNGLVTAIKVGIATIYVSSSNGLTMECEVTVEPRVIEVANISLNPTSLMLSETETTILTATVSPEDATDKTITWTSNDPKIATVENGVVTGVREGSAVITATSTNGLSASCTVTVYARPQTPKQLLRKGDGTTCTFVVMMDMTDAELTQLGYRYVYGYNDAAGESHVIAETPLRYCHTASEIYNDPSNDFWVFALLENKDGVLLNSNLRHLDGSEEVCFDASKYGFATKGGYTKVASIESEDWIRITPTAIHVDTTAHMQVAIFTMTGVKIYSKSYDGKASDNYEIELNRFTPGTYVVTVACQGRVISKKIVIR